MKIDKNTLIPDMAVYGVLVALVFGISVGLLVFAKESPNIWILYLAMAITVASGLVKFAFHSSDSHQQSA